MEPAALRERTEELPREPGVYQFLGEEATLYVGKAVDLRSRVRSYAEPRSVRIRRMLEQARDLEVAVTDTETQALLLEANLIKRHQPRYNVRLKDDKSYPMVQVTDHDVPRIEVTRDPDEAAAVFGPYTDRGRVDTVVKALRETYGIRACSDHTFADRDRPCLDYELGLCTAPCTGEIDGELYLDDVGDVLRFLAGETGVLTEPLEGRMEAAAAGRDFERAANVRDRLTAVRSFHAEGSAAIDDAGDERTVDVVGVALEGDGATVARLRAEAGKLVERDRYGLAIPPDVADRTAAIPRVLSAFLVQHYAERSLPDAIVLPEEPADGEVREWLADEGTAVRVPAAGREARLVELALKNARQGGEPRPEGAMLARALGLEGVDRIEGFDVSHAGGEAVVGSDVTFVDGRAHTAGYRRKRLTDRNDDHENMRQLLEWRGRRSVEGRDERPDPDLLVVDGGSAQLGAARSALDAVGWDVPVVALAKRDERVLTPDGAHDWPADAPQLHLLQRVRDEAHRFAVQYHRTVRDEVSTVLEEIHGIGPATRRNLLGRFGSVENVRRASVEELRSVPGVGEKTAETLAARL